MCLCERNGRDEPVKHPYRLPDAFISGEIGLPYIIQAARKYGMNGLISRFIVRPQHPSYYAFVLDGETTLGEYWETNPRSHCHDTMGHIIEWYYNGIAGILPEAAVAEGIRFQIDEGNLKERGKPVVTQISTLAKATAISLRYNLTCCAA